MQEVYHPGELRIQQLAGEQRMAQNNGRIIKNRILRGAINFIEKLPMVVISSTDMEENIWTSALIGDIGFVQVENESRLIIDGNRIRSTKEDIFFQNVLHNTHVGVLFMEPATRRRYRVNGTANLHEDQLIIEVSEAYPNCPKYIQKRTVTFPEDRETITSKITRGFQLGVTEKEWIRRADTFFVGSSDGNGWMDASHRGGNKGFVEVLADGTLKIPDYAGNSMFNTLGNFFQNPKAGILFVDFKGGESLQLSGKVTLLFDQKMEQDLAQTTGTGRFWLFETEKWMRFYPHHLADWAFIDFSPFNP